MNRQLASILKKYQFLYYILAVLAYMAVTFQRLILSVMGPEVMSDLQLDAIQFGFLGLIYTWAYALTNGPSGILLDKVGARKWLFINMLLVALGSYVFCIADSFGVALLGRIITAVTVAGCYLSGVKIISSWFPSHQFSGMFGLYTGLGALGGVVATGPIQVLMSSFGWRNSIAIIAGMFAITAVTSFLLLRDNPEDRGLPSLDRVSGEAFLSEPGDARADHINWWISTKSVLSNPRVWLIGICIMGVSASVYAITALWGGVFLEDVYGLEKSVVAEILTVHTLSFVVGGIAAGWLIKLLKHKWVILTGVAIFFFVWIYMTLNLSRLSITELKVLMIILGFVKTCCIVAGLSLTKELVAPSQIGTALGFTNGFVWILSGLFQQIWGFILKYVSGGLSPFLIKAFAVAFWTQVVVVFISFLCAVFFFYRYPSESNCNSTSIHYL